MATTGPSAFTRMDRRSDPGSAGSVRSTDVRSPGSRTTLA